MKPFKMFFGLAIAIMLFFFVAKVMFIAFVVAAVMSIMYAVFRRVKDFVTYDRYGNSYMGGRQSSQMSYSQSNSVEPLFQESTTRRHPKISNVQYVDVI
jgi:hypothetical protein